MATQERNYRKYNELEKSIQKTLKDVGNVSLKRADGDYYGRAMLSVHVGGKKVAEGTTEWLELWRKGVEFALGTKKKAPATAARTSATKPAKRVRNKEAAAAA